MGPSDSARAKELMASVGKSADTAKRRAILAEAWAAASVAAAEASSSPHAAAAAARLAVEQFGGEVVNDGHDDYDEDEDDDDFDNGRNSRGGSRSRGAGGGRRSSEAVTNSLKMLFDAVDTDLSGEVIYFECNGFLRFTSHFFSW